MPCITLLSDFGLQDASSAIAKGILMQQTGLPVLDISHEVTPWHRGQAAYLLACSYKNFPAGTCHVVLLDVFGTADPCLILCAHEYQLFLAADNGILPAALGYTPATWRCMQLKKEGSFIDWVNEAGRIISKLQSQTPGSLELPLQQLQPQSTDYMPAAENMITGEVVHIDNYENVVLSITRKQFDDARQGRSFRLGFMAVEEIEEISTNYSDVRQGFKLARFNSNGYLEICINRGKAASLFGLRLNGINNEVKITFE